MNEGQKQTADEFSASFAAKTTKPRSWEEERESSASDFFATLNQRPVNHAQPEVRRELTSSEFLEFLKQGPESRFRNARSMSSEGNSHSSPNKSQSMHNKDRNQEYQSVAIDQCDITSSVDYGSRDYYPPSTLASETSYTRKENEYEESYESCTATRGNWWQGSFYY